MDEKRVIELVKNYANILLTGLVLFFLMRYVNENDEQTEVLNRLITRIEVLDVRLKAIEGYVYRTQK